MKKKILFSIDSLHCAGAEKSLVTLLSLIDYSKYEVDLQLFGYGGALEELLPKEVNLLEPLKYTSFCDLSFKVAITESIKSLNFAKLLARLKFTLSIRKEKYTNAQKARIFWQKVSNVIEKNDKEYDIVSYHLTGLEKEFQKNYYKIYDKIIAVSDSTREILNEVFPEYKNKTEVIYDINDSNFISKMSVIEYGYDDDFDGLRILTVGRLANQKGYDIALEACKILKEKGIHFRWYSLGIGPLKDEIEKYIANNRLEDYFKLLGVKSNPYPYIRNCDIYVQTSKFEGFGLAIAEARMLNKPVVTTRFDAVYNQMIDRKNGLVVNMNARSVSDGILELINNKELKNEIVDYLAREKKGNIEELDKFYELIG